MTGIMARDACCGRCRTFRSRWWGAVAVALVLAAAPARAQPPAPAQPRPAVDTAALNALRAENARLAARVDSLTDGLRDHRFAESFLDSALEQQAALYGVFVTVIVAIFSLATYRDIRSEVRRSDKEMREELKNARDEMRRMEADLRKAQGEVLEAQQREIQQASVRQAEAQRFMRRTAGNAYGAIGSLHAESAPGSAVAAWLLAAANFYAAHTASGDGADEIGVEYLRQALGALEMISGGPRQKAAEEELTTEGARVREALELLRDQRGAEVEDLVDRIRVRLRKLGYDAAPGR